MSLGAPEDSTDVVVTVAMPVRNGGRDVALAVQSILDQSFREWELLLLDDGSTDGAVEALLHLGDARVRVLRDGRSLGLAARLNEAVALARGRYIARMDHDDVSHPDRLRQQFEFLELHPEVDLLGTRCLTIDENERILGSLPAPTSHERICARPWLGFYLAHPSWMGRTGWFRRNRYRDPGPYRCEDQELLLRTYESSKFAALPEPLLAYRVRRRPRFGILATTRFAWAMVQVQKFLHGGKLVEATLAALTGMVRVGADVIGLMTGNWVSITAGGTAVPRAQEVAWEAVIIDERQRSRRLSLKFTPDTDRPPA